MATTVHPSNDPLSSSLRRSFACVSCQHRKIKCDRQSPCQNCIKSKIQCVSASLNPRPRRRRFPERALLDRLRHYEDLLRRNDIKFEPLHRDAQAEDRQAARKQSDASQVQSSQHHSPSSENVLTPSTTSHEPPKYEAKNFWAAMNQKSHGSDDDTASDTSQDDVREAVVQDSWKTMFQGTENLLFGIRQTSYNLSTLHPDQFQIFRLWQIYLDHVDPLLKVTHTPSMQVRIIDSAQDLTRTSPETEALMFGIYCVSVHSLPEDECLAAFGATRRDLLAKFQFGCQQALSNCDFLRSNDLECLTANYLYLVSARHETDPRSLSALLGIAVRIAQRMGLHIESRNAVCTAFKAELRRRVWWALALFDARVSEMADHKNSILSPIWDCKIPANVNDFAIGPEIKQYPMTHGFPTESIFTVVRSELADFTRHCAFHLDFTTPAFKIIVKEASTSLDLGNDDLNALEQRIQEKYLKFCNPENALQFMTIWTARSILAKNRLLQHYSRHSRSGNQQTDEQRDMAISYTLDMIESDTTIAKNPLVKGYLWLVNTYFPFPAYIHLVQDLRRRPRAKLVERCWQSMNENYGSRFATLDEQKNPFFKILGKQVLQAWAAYEDACRELGRVPDRPQIIAAIERRGIKLPTTPKDPGSASAGTSVRALTGGVNMSADMGFGNDGLLFPDLPQQAFMDVDMDLFDWTAVDWGKL